MSRLAARSPESSALAVLPFRSSHLARSDGVATRVDWHPTRVHLEFLELLRAEARRVAKAGSSMIPKRVRRSSEKIMLKQ